MRDTRLKPADEPVILAGVELVSNLLQNINDIANAQAMLSDQRFRR